jgi:hypothetical protein
MKITQELGIGSIRVSSTKQGLQGDSPEDQKKQIENRAKMLNVKVPKWFNFVESASGEIQPNQEAIDFCKENQGIYRYFFIKSIDRFTRGGSYFYDHLKMQLIKYGVQLIDVYGVIGTQTVNTLEHLGIKYDWSVFNPTRVSELLEAERGKNEIRDILSRMIGAEIRYTRMGYVVRQPILGYINEKIDTPHGKRTIRKPHPVESKWVIRMFELRIQGNLTDEEIVKEINLMGFKSKIQKLHGKNNPIKIIGYRGGIPLSVKQFRKYIENPIYAGINDEKWTQGQPIRAKFDGLVTVEMFNKANRGKITIVKEGSIIKIYKGKPPMWQQRKNKNNPLYPYKPYVTCPICKNPLLGSASRGKSGKYFAAYHCNRGHYFRIKIADFDKTIDYFCRQLRFDEEFKKRFSEIVLEEWNKRQRTVSELNISLNKQVANIESEINLTKEKIKSVSSQMVIDMLANDIEKLQQNKVKLIQQRDNKEDEQVKIETLIAYTEYFMEHLHDLLLGGDDKQKNAAIFGLIFDQIPTYEELKNGTPKLSPLFTLNDAFVSSRSQSVNSEVPEWNSIINYMYKVYQTFNFLQITVNN